MTTEIADVLIVGAGPVGLAAAVALTRLGHDVVIVDRRAEGSNTSRAAVVHPRTLELLEPYGVTTPLVDRGLHAPGFTVRDRDQVLIDVPFDTLPTAYPFALMISQADTEKFLRERLSELGVLVQRPVEVATVVQGDDLVEVTRSDGEQIRARFLIGADGMHSTVREQAGIAFAGGSYAESFSLADVRISGGVPKGEGVLYFSPAGMVVVAPLPDGIHRVVATVGEAPHEPDIAFVQRLLDERGPKAVPAVVEEMVWGSRFRVHHRIADHFRDGRILLVGDAAHVHSPAGGQGMNLGIEDAVTAASTLSRVLRGEPQSLLDEHAAARRRTAESVVSMTGRLTTVATLPAAVRPLRNIAIRVAGRAELIRNKLAWQLSGLDRR